MAPELAQLAGRDDPPPARLVEAGVLVLEDLPARHRMGGREVARRSVRRGIAVEVEHVESEAVRFQAVQCRRSDIQRRVGAEVIQAPAVRVLCPVRFVIPRLAGALLARANEPLRDAAQRARPVRELDQRPPAAVSRLVDQKGLMVLDRRPPVGAAPLGIEQIDTDAQLPEPAEVAEHPLRVRAVPFGPAKQDVVRVRADPGRLVRLLLERPQQPLLPCLGAVALGHRHVVQVPREVDEQPPRVGEGAQLVGPGEVQDRSVARQVVRADLGVPPRVDGGAEPRAVAGQAEHRQRPASADLDRLRPAAGQRVRDSRRGPDTRSRAGSTR